MLATHADKLPLARERRAALGKGLRTFAERVDSYLSERRRAPLLVVRYARGVEKAASDLTNRKARHTALESQLKSVLK